MPQVFDQQIAQMSTQIGCVPDGFQFPVVCIGVDTSQVVQPCPQLRTYKQGALAFQYIAAQPSGFLREAPRKCVIEYGLMDEADSPFRPSQYAFGLQCLDVICLVVEPNFG